MRNRRPSRGSGSRAARILSVGLVLAVVVGIGLGTWLWAGPVAAAPTTTTQSAGEDDSADDGAIVGTQSSTVKTDITGAPLLPTTTTNAATASSMVPPVGPVLPFDASAPRPYVDENDCLSCHGKQSGLMVKQRADGSHVALYVDPKRLEFSVHRFNDCTRCHTAEPHDSQSPLTKLSLAEKCGSCHQFEFKQYIKSVHGAPQTSGNSDPATCVDCHSSTSNPHDVVRVLDPSAATYPTNVARTCAKCHDDEKLMGKYGIVEKVYESYMQSFHGKAITLSGESASLQQLNKATCINCHGAHNVSAVSDPNSPVAGMDNLTKTCEQCHPNAGTQFAAGFLGHKEADPEHIPQVFWGEKFFYVFTRGVLAFGVVLVVGPFARRGVDRIKRNKKSVERRPATETGADEQPGGEQQQDEEV